MSYQPSEAEVEALAEFIDSTSGMAREWWEQEMPESPDAIIAVHALTDHLLPRMSHLAAVHGTPSAVNYMTAFLGTLHAVTSRLLGEEGEGRFYAAGAEVPGDD